ncbi:hypothetical protein Hanom_Chr00s109689g01807221 [Helianthus anomalus]
MARRKLSWSSSPKSNKSLKLKLKSNPKRLHDYKFVITKSWGLQGIWRLNKLGVAWSESGSNESSIEEKRSSDAR